MIQNGSALIVKEYSRRSRQTFCVTIKKEFPSAHSPPSEYTHLYQKSLNIKLDIYA